MRFWVSIAVVLAACNCPPPSDDASVDAVLDMLRQDSDVEAGDSELVDARTDSTPDAPPTLGPPYPVVFAHGFFGFENFAGLTFETYFFEVKEDLLAEGESWVFTPAVDPFNDSTRRGIQLEERIDEILTETGHDKVILIGHSQGGIDARHVAHHLPERVAAVVTISTPHEGTRIADIAASLSADDRLASVIDALARAVAAPLFDEAGNETSVMASIRQLSSEGMQTFNADTPDGSVPIYSIAGRSDRHLGGDDCQAENRPGFVRDLDLVVDPIDPLFAVTEEILDGGLLAPFPNDGLVRVADAKRGRFLGCIPADHMDQVGQILGDSPGLLNRFDHKEFYRALVSFLRTEGH